MDLKEVISEMKNKYDASMFEVMLARMRDKASRGLIEGVSADDIDKVLETPQAPKEPDDSESTDGLFVQEIYEMSNFLEAYDRIQEEEISEILDECDAEDLNESSRVRDQKYINKHDPEEYVVQSYYSSPRSIVKQLLSMFNLSKNNNTSEEAAAIIERVKDDEQLSGIISEIEEAGRETPIDRNKIKTLYKKFKIAYSSKKRAIISAAKDDIKISKMESKKLKNNLYESELSKILGGDYE